jgi:hemolysin activation/secretion protein
MRRALVLFSLIAVPLVCAAQDLGKAQSPANPNAPAYPPLTIPGETPYRLPSLPDVPPADSRGGPIAQGLSVFVKQIRLEGATVLTPAQAAVIVEPYENKQLDTADLQEIRVALTKWYIARGYVSSGVVLPDQRIIAGVVVFKALEGELTRIELTGRHSIRSSYVVARLRRFIKRPLNVLDLQEALRYLQQDPNILRLDARLSAGEKQGQSILRLKVQEQPRFSAGIETDNHRASSTGANLTSVLLSARDIAGFGEELAGSIGRSQGTTLGSANITVPVSARDTSIQIYYARSAADIIDNPFRSLDITSRFETRGISVRAPLIENLSNRFSLVAGFESNRSTTYLLGEPFSFSPGAQNGRATTAVGILGIEWAEHGRSEALALRLTFRHGFDWLNATIYTPRTEQDVLANPTGADGRFSLVQGQISYLEKVNAIPWFARLNDRAQLELRGSAQVSLSPLMTLEKLAIGGVTTVRGYPENLLVRDNGVAGTIELQLPLPGYRPNPSPFNAVISEFIDYGRSWDKRNTDPGSGIGSTTVPRYIASAGVGLLYQPVRGLDAQLYWGRGIANNFHGDDPRTNRNHDLQERGIHYAVSYSVRW